MRRYFENMWRERIVHSQQSDDRRFSSHRSSDRSHMRQFPTVRKISERRDRAARKIARPLAQRRRVSRIVTSFAHQIHTFLSDCAPAAGTFGLTCADGETSRSTRVGPIASPHQRPVTGNRRKREQSHNGRDARRKCSPERRPCRTVRGNYIRAVKSSRRMHVHTRARTRREIREKRRQWA